MERMLLAIQIESELLIYDLDLCQPGIWSQVVARVEWPQCTVRLDRLRLRASFRQVKKLIENAMHDILKRVVGRQAIEHNHKGEARVRQHH